ncbi:MAG: hypothetical protein QOH24_1962 [Verrucomicrobiota bacterium]|jgi:hypothetical protein
MFTVYIVVTLLVAAANIFSAVCDFVRYNQVLINMAVYRDGADTATERRGYIGWVRQNARAPFA